MSSLTELPNLLVAVVPGDDAAPEAMQATLHVLGAIDAPVRWQIVDGLSEEAVAAAAAAADAVLFGATNGRTGGIGYLRWGRGAYANVRPIRWRPGAPSPLLDPSGIDYVIVRENTEDLYLGIEGDLGDLRASGLDTRPWGGRVNPRHDPNASRDGRYAVKVITREGTERVARFAFRLARRRKATGSAGRLAIGCKWNALPQSDGFFREVVSEVAGDFPDIELCDFLADDLARRLVASPREMDVVLLPNLYGDILSDEAAATVGGLGLTPSGCYGDDNAYFEPVHGTAPDLVGQGRINPIATILSAAMLLAHVGLDRHASTLQDAVDSTLAARDRLTPDLGGTATTFECAAAIAARV